jgi:predicted permease
LEEIEQVYRLDVELRGVRFARRALWREILSVQWISLGREARRLDSTDQSLSPASWRTPVSSLLRDVQYATRVLKRSPGFSILAVVTLALGIGANTAIFSVVNGVLLRPLPYRAPEQLVYIWDRLDWIGFPRASVSGPQIHELREQARSFTAFAALRTGTSQMTGVGEPEQVSAASASANVFELLGVNAVQGRTFLAGEDAPGAPYVVVLSDGLWRRRFGSDPAVVGRTVNLDGRETTITGVLPRDFDFQIHHSLGQPSGAEIWIPEKADLANAPRGQHSFAVLARIADGVNFDQATAELAALGAQQDAEWYGDNGFTYTAIPVQEDLVKDVRPVLLLLLGAVGFLLLIATANIATLMLARSQLRVQEIAVRSALGASRSRIMWLTFMEGGVLAAVGGALGFVLAVYGLDALIGLAPDNLPRSRSVAVDGHIFAFTGSVALVTAVLCGITPAFQSSSAQRGRDWTSCANAQCHRSGRGRTFTGVADRCRTLGS